MFTKGEIAYLKSEFSPRFGALPRLADGFLLRSWKSGPNRGQPRLPAAAASLRDKGYLEIRQERSVQPSRAFLTIDGLAALSAAFFVHHLLDPKRFEHIATELDTHLSNDAAGKPL
jgi:hypothetical protein